MGGASCISMTIMIALISAGFKVAKPDRSHPPSSTCPSAQQSPALLQQLEALMMQDDAEEDDDDKDAASSGGGLLASLPGGEHIRHEDLEDMEDIDW